MLAKQYSKTCGTSKAIKETSLKPSKKKTNEMQLEYDQVIARMEASKYPEPISMPERVEIIKEKASGMNIKIKDIAKAVGFPKEYFSRWANEYNMRDMRIDEVLQICRILHVPLELLLFGKKYRDLIVVDKQDLKRITEELEHLIE